MCHWCLYKRSVRLFEYEKYHVVTAELHCLLRLFDKKVYVCGTCPKHFSGYETPCETAFNKNEFRSYPRLPEELKDFKKLEKKNSERAIFTKINNAWKRRN